MQLHNSIYAVVAAIVLFTQTFITNAIPLKRNRRSSGVAEFRMPEQSHSSYPWAVPNPNLTQTQQSSQDAFIDNYMTCPTAVREGADISTNLRSTCPWYFMADHDPTRFPTTVLKAVSPCKFCIGSNEALECVPIFKEVSILKQEGKDAETGSIIYTESTMTVKNGFTCAGKRTAANAATGSIPDIDKKK